MPSSRTASGRTGTPPGAESPLRRLAPRSSRPTLAERVLGPGTILAAVGLLLGLLLAAVPAPDRPEPSPEARAAGSRMHRVREGDNLRGLAREYYEDPSLWRQIFLANREKLTREGRLVPGDEIVIPVFEGDRGERED